MAENGKCCGECAHWKRARPYSWGDCDAPLPIWARDDIGSPPRFKHHGVDCDAFKRNAGQVVIAWLYEDTLPPEYPYDAMLPHSKVDGVRMFPVFAPPEPLEQEVMK